MFKESNPGSKLQDFMISKRTEIIKIAKELQNKLTAPVQKDKISICLSLAEGKCVQLCRALINKSRNPNRTRLFIFVNY